MGNSDLINVGPRNSCDKTASFTSENPCGADIGINVASKAKSQIRRRRSLMSNNADHRFDSSLATASDSLENPTMFDMFFVERIYLGTSCFFFYFNYE